MVDCSIEGCDFQAVAMVGERFFCTLHMSELAPSPKAAPAPQGQLAENPWKRFPETAVETSMRGYSWRVKTAGLVEVRNLDGTVYDVAQDGCSCPGWKYYSKCKHHRTLSRLGIFGGAA